MPAIGVRKAAVRWNDATQAFELLCEDCARGRTGPTFWPLTLEYWTPGNLQRCRGCAAERKRRQERERKRRLEPAAVRRRNRAYYVANHDLLRAKDNARKADRRLQSTA